MDEAQREEILFEAMSKELSDAANQIRQTTYRVVTELVEEKVREIMKRKEQLGSRKGLLERVWKAESDL